MEGKVVVVTGASSGIGRAVASVFVREGAKVMAVGRNEAELGSLRDSANHRSGTVRIHLADVTETLHVDRLVSETVDQFGQIDVLVNSAGIIKTGSVENTTLGDWDKMMDINVRSVFYLMQKCVPFLEVSKGNVVNVSSVTGTKVLSGCACLLRFKGRCRSIDALRGLGTCAKRNSCECRKPGRCRNESPQTRRHERGRLRRFSCQCC